MSGSVDLARVEEAKRRHEHADTVSRTSWSQRMHDAHADRAFLLATVTRLAEAVGRGERELNIAARHAVLQAEEIAKQKESHARRRAALEQAERALDAEQDECATWRMRYEAAQEESARLVEWKVRHEKCAEEWEQANLTMAARENELHEQKDAELARLRAALETAKRTIRTWSEMGSSAPPQWLDEEWALYQESPEMKQINAALAPRPTPETMP